MRYFDNMPRLGATPATSAPANPFGGFGAASTATSTPTAAAATTNPSPFAGFGTTPASTTASAAPTTSSLYPSLTTSTAATSAAAAPSLFATAPSTLTTGSLFGGSNSTAATTALNSAASKNPLTTSTLSATPAAITLTPDTIAGSTKYTELPADAKATLDQLHTFLQGQIHLSGTLSARSSESLDKISKDTSELSKRLETLNDALDRDTKMIDALQDKVVQEFKQADSAGRIIEAYANTSQANFLYAGNNSASQYFMERCADFEEQLRQYRSTIEEIERHLASFGSKNPQMSYAFPEVMRDQQEGFLAIAGKVAALHDEIKDREKAYLMFRRKYYDDDFDPFQTNNKYRKMDTTHHNGHSLRSNGRSLESQKSFREIAKETLRPGLGSSAAPPTAAAPVTGSSLFSTAPSLGSTSLFGKPAGTTTTTAPTFSLTTPAATNTPASTGLFGAPASTAPTTSLFGAPSTSAAPSTSLFGAPAASTAAPSTSLFGAPAASTAAPSTGLFGAPATSTAAPSTGPLGAPATSAPTTNLFGAPAASAPATGLFGAPAATAASPFGGLKFGGK
ncbi:Nucleoporin p58/p45 [Linnemannia zychae]|nr:Nucleoporin p58/p45 [Linnemannia zychae]